MGDDAASRKGWGVVLGGDVNDLEVWQDVFKLFNPWVMKSEVGLILRSRQLDLEATPSAAYERAKALLDEVNGAMRASRRTGNVRLEDVVEVFSDGTFRRHVSAQIVEVLRLKPRAVAVMLGPDGRHTRTPPPEPSEPQRWLRIATKDDLLADALVYFARCDDWFDIYKALECLEMRFGGARKGQAERFRRLGWADPEKIDLLRWTANSGRHARKKFDPPPHPMERTEARDLLAELMVRAFNEARPRRMASGERTSPIHG